MARQRQQRQSWSNGARAAWPKVIAIRAEHGGGRIA
jgi:hypothetical protein